MGTFNELRANLDRDDERRRGTQFEYICQWFLTNDPAYKALLRRVWLWKEWTGRWSGTEAGIDLVAEDHDGKLWAIQCKAYRPDSSVTKRDVDKFLSESNRAQFAFRMLIATTDKLHPIAQRTIQNQEKKVTFLGLAQLQQADDYLDWPTTPSALRPSPLAKPKRPWDYQRTAVNDVVKGFKSADRGQLIMACGTGKTLTAWFLTEKLAAERTLILVPSLSLLKQTMREWQTADPKKPFASLPVCSDETVGSLGDDAAVSHTSDLGVPVTTDPVAIAEFLRKRSGPRVVFSTYQSSPRIAAAFALGRVPEFDLVIADEAHRVAGPVGSDFATVLDRAAIKTKRQLFMTATPRYFTGRVVGQAKEAEDEVASMDDHTKFGEVFHRLTFSEAIERKLLTDYQVAIIGVDDATYRDWAERAVLVKLDDTKRTDARSLAGQIGLAKAMRKYDLRRVISFHNRVKGAKEFADSMPTVLAWMPAGQRPKGTLWSHYASGEMSAGQRHVLLQYLKRLNDGERGLLANARCLAEGVDVPALDGVAFIDPRRSEVDIVQAVGRAIRKSDSKTVGTIVIPVFIDTEEAPELALDSSVFKPVWDVVKALRAHDEKLGTELDELRRELGRKRGRPRLPAKIRHDLPATVGTDFARAFEIRLVEQTTLTWEFWYGLLQRYVEDNGHARVPGEYRVADYRLGRWVIKQRSKGVAGYLNDHRKRLLESLSGWTWDTADYRWDEGFEHLLRYAKRHGNTMIPAQHRLDGYKLGQWVTVQRQSYNKGSLEQERQVRLEDVPGWTWNPIDDLWEIGYEHLRRYVEVHGTARPPQDCVVDGYRLGSWTATQRNRQKQGTLEIERQRRLEALAGWAWDARSARWEETFDTLRRYAEKYGDSLVPQDTVFDGIKLGQWVAVTRDSKKNAALTPDRQRRLEQLPGWTWDTRVSQWDASYSRLCEYVTHHGNARVPSEYEVDGVKLGRWVVSLRVKKASGKLADTKIQQLERLPGWTWDTAEEKWQEGLRHLIDYARENGHARVTPKFVSADGYRLGLWAANLRARRDKVEPAHARQLEAVPGWSWDPYSDAWDDGLRHLVEYVGEHGNARPSREFLCSDGFRLGQWVTVQRVTKLRKGMEEQRVRKLESLPGWTWEPREEAWEEGFEHLTEFVRESGRANPTQTYVCSDGFKLGVWVSTQRSGYSKGKLSRERQSRLDMQPGWMWNPPRGAGARRG